MDRRVRIEDSSLHDPWAPLGPGKPARFQTAAGLLAPRLGAWALGALGPVLRVMPNGDTGRQGALILAAISLVFAMALPAGRVNGPRAAGAVGAALAGCLLTFPTIGRAPALVALGAVLVAHAALVGIGPWRDGATDETPRAGLALPLLAFAGLSWYRHGETARVVMLLAAAGLVVELYRHRPERIRRLDAAVASGAMAIARTAASALLLVALLVTLYLPGAAATAIGRLRRRQPTTSSWVVASNSLDDQRRDASYPFVTTPPAEARRRLLAGLTLLAVVVGSTWLIVRPDPVLQSAADTREHGPPAAPSRTSEDAPIIFGREFDVRYTDLPAYSDESWADDLQTQEAAVPSVETFSSSYINLRDHRRVTTAPRPCACRSAKVWLTGGSAVWGIGQRDDRTIASAMVRAATAAGLQLSIDNMGERGSLFEGQIDAVEARLAREPAPDVIVFYNGFNEAGSALSDIFLRNGDPRDRAMLEGDQQELRMRMEDLDELNARVEGYLESDVGPETGAATAHGYRNAVSRMDELARRHELEVRYVFQADAFASRHQLEPYEMISNIPTDLMAISPISIGLRTAADELGDEVIDLRHVFDEVDEQVFLGLVHHNETGARIVANELVDIVNEALATP